MPVYLILFTMLLTPLLSSAAIYKWTDAQGNVHYSQEKPKSAVGKLDKLRVNHHAPVDRSTYKRPGSNDLKTKKTEKNTEKKTEKKKLSPKQRAKYCASAKRNLQTLRAKAQIKQRDKKGNVRFITEKEKQARIKQAQDFVRKNCR